MSAAGDASGPARYPKLTVRASQEVIDAAKAAYTLDADRYRTFSAWVEAALLAGVERTKTERGVTDLPDLGSTNLTAGRPRTNDTP